MTGGRSGGRTTMATITAAVASDPRPRRHGRHLAPALLGGALVALSLPPWGWWPLAFLGVAVLSRCLSGLSTRRRLGVGVAFGLGQFAPGLWWMGEFNAVGAVLVVLLETSFVAAAAAATPPGRWRVLA
ncbi:MAG: hypothetical protein M3N68_07230, partial [Actinomycetota bacterium]|nr:hypothetical protein [Actinomycetota bacterium]